MWWRRQEHEVQWTMRNCYRGEHFSDNTQKWWSQHGLRKQRSAQHLWRHTDAFQGMSCSPRGSSSNIASTDERTLGDSIKNTFSQKKILSGRTTLVLIAAEQKEELVGIIVERAAAGFSPESPARETQFPWHSKCHAALPESALINQLHCHEMNLYLVEFQMVHSLQHKIITAFSKA